jgi:hypothetical protein
MTTPQLIEYIQSQSKLGVSRQTITATLIGQGWSAADVNEGFASSMPASSQVSFTPVTSTTPITPASASPVSQASPVVSAPYIPNNAVFPASYSAPMNATMPVASPIIAPQQAQAQPKKNKTALIVTLIIVVLLLCAGGWYWYAYMSPASTTALEQTPVSAVVDNTPNVPTNTVSQAVVPSNTASTNVVKTTVTKSVTPATPAPVQAPAPVKNSPPVITRRGPAQMTVTVGKTYTDAGATAYDSTDGTITSQIVTTGLPVNTAQVGTYTIKYNVTDSSGLSALQVERIVAVVAPPVDAYGSKTAISPGVYLTISQPQPYTIATPSGYQDSDYQPDSGYHYMIITVSADNQSQGNFGINQGNFHLTDPSGEGYAVVKKLVNNQSTSFSVQGNSQTGVMSSYTQTSGNLVFEVPNSLSATTAFTVHYQSDDASLTAVFGNN